MLVILEFDLSDFGDLAGPADFWIGNTNPCTTATQVEQVLNKFAQNLKVDNFRVDVFTTY